MRTTANKCGIAFGVGILLLLLAACRTPLPESVAPRGLRIHEAPAPSREEAYCAWYADARGPTLYVGESAFWDASRRAGGDPRADLRIPGPQRVGRFDLAGERWLPALPVREGLAGGGTWDVLAHPNGRIYFTTFFDAAGFVEPESGRVRRFPAAGPGLNELERLPDGRLLASRYAAPGGGSGSLVILDPEGRLLRELPLADAEGRVVAPKTVAFDPLRGEIWVTTDLLDAAGAPLGHDARVLDAASGAPLRRIEDREVQFVRFREDGAAALVERRGSQLWLRWRAAGSPEDPGGVRPARLLDARFPADSDFAQDITFTAEGAVVVTRWSGRLHRLDPHGALETLTLPRPPPVGLYYTAVQHAGRICATYCSGLRVVCASWPTLGVATSEPAAGR